MTTPDPLLVVTTGGTIDKAYFDAQSDYQIGESVVGRLLQIANVTHSYRTIEFSRKDSLDMTDADRAALRKTLEESGASRILVTHGTDTMTTTADALSSLDGRTIVLTGALSPARFAESDAAFNLGMAFAVAQVAPAGVYIAMNGEVFRAGEVRKDREQARFVRTEPGIGDRNR
jgi:L-asparaginase